MRETKQRQSNTFLLVLTLHLWHSGGLSRRYQRTRHHKCQTNLIQVLYLHAKNIKAQITSTFYFFKCK